MPLSVAHPFSECSLTYLIENVYASFAPVNTKPRQFQIPFEILLATDNIVTKGLQHRLQFTKPLQPSCDNLNLSEIDTCNIKIAQKRPGNLSITLLSLSLSNLSYLSNR